MQRWGSCDTLSLASAHDDLTRIYRVPGRPASVVRRYGIGLVGRISPRRNRLMNEARGTSGELPLLLRGLPIYPTESWARSRRRRSLPPGGIASAAPANRLVRRA